MQCVIRAGEDFVFTTHEDQQDLSSLYPGADVVTVPHDFRFAFDEFNRLLDPRRFAAEGQAPIAATKR